MTATHSPPRRSFASDNYAGVHPRVMEALQHANQGHAMAYGGDPLTRRACDELRAHFGSRSSAYFVFLGTAANVLGLQTCVRPHQSVLCAQSAHINVDECGAPERHLGAKLIPVAHDHGKIAPESLAPLLASRGFEHHSQPAAVSVTQPTELGVCYTVEELHALGEFCAREGLAFHMDGARLANAAAALDVPLAAMTRDVGVDVLSLGGGKNGMMYGEAVVFLKEGLDAEFSYIRKQGMQLGSKMRFLAAQFSAMFGGELWLENARRANAMAQRLAEAVTAHPGVALTQPVETNVVFASLPAAAVAPLQAQFPFYLWNRDGRDGDPVARWMTAFDTTPDDVDAFAHALRALVSA